jgi:hypothetical protein
MHQSGIPQELIQRATDGGTAKGLYWLPGCGHDTLHLLQNDGVRRSPLEETMGWLEPKPLPQGADVDQVNAALEAALRAKDRHEALVMFVREQFARGYDAGEVLGILEQFRAKLREQDRDTDEDDVMEVMDRLLGWCAPSALLRPASTHSG